jgi:hypothetical protein
MSDPNQLIGKTITSVTYFPEEKSWELTLGHDQRVYFAVEDIDCGCRERHIELEIQEVEG